MVRPPWNRTGRTWKWPVWTGTPSHVTVARSLTALPDMSLRRDDRSSDTNYPFKEALARLTEQERLVCVWLQLGFSHHRCVSMILCLLEAASMPDHDSRFA